MATILPFRGMEPRIAADAFVAPTAVLVGDVTVEPEASVWFGAVLRGDSPEHGIVVGARTSVQDNCVVHVGDQGPTLIGADCVVGHGATFECCEIGDGTLVGMNAVILQNARIGAGCLVAAGAVVLEGTEVPAGRLVAGAPAKVRKEVEPPVAERIREGARHYVEQSRAYRAEGIGRAGAGAPADEP